jgi:hypothetical protein
MPDRNIGSEDYEPLNRRSRQSDGNSDVLCYRRRVSFQKLILF